MHGNTEQKYPFLRINSKWLNTLIIILCKFTVGVFPTKTLLARFYFKI